MGRDKSTARKGKSKHSKNDQSEKEISRKKSSNIDKEEAGKVSGNERDISVDKTVVLLDVTTKGMKDLDRSVVDLDDSKKSEEIATENNHLDNKGLTEEKSLKVSTAEENKELSEGHKKASKSGKKDSHKQKSKSKRRSCSHSSDKEESRRHKRRSRGDNHSSDRSSRKSRKRELSDTEKDIVTRKSHTLEQISEVLAKEDNNNDDSLEMILKPDPDSSLLLEEDISMDSTLPKENTSEQTKPKKENPAKKEKPAEFEMTKDSLPFKSARKVIVNRNKVNDESRKHKWSSSKDSKATMEISSFSLRTLVPDVKPLSPSELKLETESDECSDNKETSILSRDKVNGRMEVTTKEDTAVSDQEIPAKGNVHRHKRHHDSRERDESVKKHSSRREIERRDDSRKRGYDDRGSSRHSRSIQIVEADAPPIKLSIAPAKNSSSQVITVCNLVRPFTVKQLKDLLQRTGTLVKNGFWIDNVKSRCVAMFEEEDQAVETRMALHGVKWPSVNPKHLLVDFSTETELKKKLQESPHLNPIIVDDSKFDRRKVDGPVREWDLAKMGERSPGEKERERERRRRDRENERSARERRTDQSPNRPDDRTVVKKPIEIKSLDDLFAKTKTQPSIYWLPLSEQEISEKETMRRKKMIEQERREAEMKEAHERQRAIRLKERQRRRSRSPRRSRRSSSTTRRRRSKSRSRSRS